MRAGKALSWKREMDQQASDGRHLDGRGGFHRKPVAGSAGPAEVVVAAAGSSTGGGMPSRTGNATRGEKKQSRQSMSVS